jgi:hypothetical protein
MRCALLSLLVLCGCASARQEVPQPAPPVAGDLVVIGDESASADAYAAWGLTGENKPNGPQYRFRESVPAGTPAYVARTREALRLMIADTTPDGWLAFYKGPLGEDWANAQYRATLYAPDGSMRFDLPLNPLLSATRHLEIQDIRYADGTLYFNEACQTYARDAGGRCSALLAVDPHAARVLWRTAPLTSNNILLVHGPHIIAGYGFTAEPDSLFLLRRSDGVVLDRLGLDSAHRYLEIRDGVLHVLTQTRRLRIRLDG